MNPIRNKGQRLVHILSALVLGGLLAACSVLPQRAPPPPVYDLGPVPIEETAEPGGHPALVTRIAADAVYDDRGVYYRLLYRDPARLRRYNEARWAVPPAKLLEERLRVRLADRAQELGRLSGSIARYRLQGRLESFEQRYPTPTKAEAVVRMHLTLVAPAERRLIAQRLIAVSVPTERGIPGAVNGLAEAGRLSVERAVDWLAGLGWADSGDPGE